MISQFLQPAMLTQLLWPQFKTVIRDFLRRLTSKMNILERLKLPIEMLLFIINIQEDSMSVASETTSDSKSAETPKTAGAAGRARSKRKKAGAAKGKKKDEEAEAKKEEAESEEEASEAEEEEDEAKEDVSFSHA